MMSWARDPIQSHRVYEQDEHELRVDQSERDRGHEQRPTSRRRVSVKGAPFALLAIVGVVAGLLAARSPFHAARTDGPTNEGGSPSGKRLSRGLSRARRAEAAPRFAPRRPRSSSHRKRRIAGRKAHRPPTAIPSVPDEGVADVSPVGSRVEFGFER